MRKIITSVSAACLLVSAFPSFAEEVLLSENDPVEISEDMDAEALPQASAIMDALQEMTELSGDTLAQAIASLMVQFTTVTSEDDFVRSVEIWRQNLPGILAANAPDVDSDAVLEAILSTQWFSPGHDAPAVHFVMDTACAPCLEMFSELRRKSDAQEIDLRVTILPFVEENTFLMSLGFLNDRDSAWENLTRFLDDEIASEDFSVEPSLANEDLQAVVEQDYDAIINTGIRNLPVMAIQSSDGEARIVIGSLVGDDLEEFLSN